MLRQTISRYLHAVTASGTQLSTLGVNSAASSHASLLEAVLRPWLLQSISWQLYNQRWMSTDGSGNKEGAPASTDDVQHSGFLSTRTTEPVDLDSPAAIPEDLDVALDQWGAAMEEGDWDTAWNVFEAALPVDAPHFPELEELLAFDADADDRAVRRQREENLQEDVARSRVRKIDQQGRAHAVGRRKTSVARVWIRQGQGHLMINRRPYDAYFPSFERRNDLITPFELTNTLGRFDVMAAVGGGGLTGQAQALRHGIARALQCWDPEMRPALKAAGLLTRDARIVERKKPGRKKARKAFQWVKR